VPDERHDVTERTVTDATEPTAAPPTVPAPARRIGRYAIEAPLGAGGMAEVFAAYDTVLRRHVALKILHPSGAGDEAQQRRRVLREARAAAALTHPNTVTIFDVGEAEGVVFIAMELLEGETLRSALRRDVTVEQRLGWLLDAARALLEAHARGLVHRDVKPENMFVCDDGTVKLLDFGIAKRDEIEGGAREDALGPSSLRTVEGRLVGTPRYMAPEQKRAEPTDARTDQYAWGLVAFELLTGVQPVAGITTIKVDGDGSAGAVTSGSPYIGRLRAVEGLEEDLAAAIARALEPRKEDRFASMDPIVALLSARRGIARADTPHTGAAPSADARDVKDEPPTLGPPPRRRRIAWLASGAFLAAALAGALALAVRTRPAADGPPEPAGPPACTVEATRELPIHEGDRATLLSTGELVIARANGPNGRPTYEREIDGRLARFDPYHSLPITDRDVFIGAGAFAGEPVLLLTSKGGSVSTLWTARNLRGIHRHGGLVDDLAVVDQAVTSFEKGIAAAFVYTSLGADAGAERAAGSLDVITIGVGEVARPQPQLRSATPPFFIAIAASDHRLGITFASGGALKFALVEPTGRLSGDVLQVAKGMHASALAFAGDVAVAFWVERRGETTRLFSSSLPMGAVAFTEPAVAARGAVAPLRPVAARLASGAYVLAWVSVTGGVHSVRLAAIRPTGELEASSVAGTGNHVRDPVVAATGRGADVAWIDDAAHVVRVASLVCAAR